MRISIDISSIVYGTGVSVYTQNLVRALAAIDKKNEYILFGGSLRQVGKFNDFYHQLRTDFGADNFTLKTFPLSPKLQTLIWNEWHTLPLEWLTGKVDVYHSPDWSLAPSQAKTIITVHDLFFLKRPDLQQHPYRDTLEKRLKRARDLKLPAIAVSKATKVDLIELINYPEELINVIYESTDEAFNIPVNIKNKKDKQLKEILNKYHIQEPYLLMVGTLEPRKNLQRTIESFRMAVGAPLVGARRGRATTRVSPTLVIAGKVGWGEQLQPVENVKLVGYVPQEDLPSLYTNATGFLYPSLYEGFGIPILEAFACGCPVLTSDISSMPEIAGDAAIYVKHDDVNSIRDGLEKLLNLKTADRSRLIQNGYKQMKKFSWEKAARETLEIYKSL